MNLHIASILIVIAATATMVWAQTPAATTPSTAPATAPAQKTESAFKTEKERVGYAIGLELGGKLKGIEVDGAALAAGINDAASGAKPKMTDAEIEETLVKLQKTVTEKADSEAAAASEVNQKAGDAFLLENGKKDGVKTTLSGLQYKVIKSGTGKMPKATDTVSVNYRGTLVNGKEFDASNGTPVSFPVNRVIPGWTEALQLMKEGDKWMVYIPSKLAYGERGTQGGPIGPNETLIFEVELISIK